MSFLYCIKDPTPFILIGGVSGVGKTTIIDYLLERYSNFFAQPISYTTREKRHDNERYEFVEKQEIQQLFKNGELLNLDDVYGELYAVSKRSLQDIIKAGKIPVKEIHPNNFHKFKLNESIEAISILIEREPGSGCDDTSPREGRPDSEHWKDDSNIDIKINISGLNVEGSVAQILYRIYAFRKHILQHEHPYEIERTNMQGYNRLAEEFLEEKRVTTKNFHDASLAFWKKHLSEIKPNNRVLELGVGNGWLLSNVNINTNDIVGADLSDNMSADYIKRMYSCSSRSVPIEAGSIDYIVSSLADPFFYPETLVEIHRLLKRGGKFIFTLPSSTWAKNLKTRTDLNKTTFTKQNGESVTVYSLCSGLDSVLDIISILSMDILSSEEMRLPEEYTHSVSPAISSSSAQFKRPVGDMPIIMGHVVAKR